MDLWHPLRGYLHESGATVAELEFFLDNPCPPNLLGANYYVTSERYLGDRLEHYPESAQGGNGRHWYADTEAVRVLPGGQRGLAVLLGEAWDCYRLLIAVTEAYLGCDCLIEQVRWLGWVWNETARARSGGADVQAITAWSAFGSFDWGSLVTVPTGRYEAGIFEVRTDPPVEAPLADLIRGLAIGRPDHLALDQPG